MSSHTKSLELNERALKVTPGPQSNLAGVWTGDSPLFLTRGKGSHIWDVDGNEYIDYTNGLGPGILGYANEEYNQALKKQIDEMIYHSTFHQSPMEIELAEKLTQLIPCAERVRFLLSGSEAVQLTIRLARAYTKRSYFIRFEGHYHGWIDNVLGGVVDDNATGKPFAIDSDTDYLRTDGRSPTSFEESFKIPWNDIEILEKVLEKYGEEVALIHMEAIPLNTGAFPCRPGYLERVRELCNKYGIVLSFDEIITGFRVGLSGAQGLLGVTPDIATFGKAIGGGVPISAVAGKKEILDQLIEQRVLGAGTFNGYPLGLAASLATIKLLERDNGAIYKHIDKVQQQLIAGLKELGKKYGIPILFLGPRGCLYTHFIDKEIAYSVRDLKELDETRLKVFRSLLHEEGITILQRGKWFISGALTETDIDKTLTCAEHAMSKV